MKITVPEKFGIDPVAAGVYKALVSKTEVVTTEAKPGKASKPMIKVEYTLQSQGPNPQEKTIGRKVFDNLVISEETLWRVDIAVRAATGAGIPKGDYEIDELVMKLTSLIENKEVMLRLDVEPAKDKSGQVVAGQFRNVIKETKAVA